MFVAEAFPIQSEIIKGLRRHAKEKWAKIRYRYIHLFVRFVCYIFIFKITFINFFDKNLVKFLIILGLKKAIILNG